MSARSVRYEITAAAVHAGTSFDLTGMVVGLEVSLDMDRVTFATATMQLADPSDALQDILDPRSSEGTILAFRVVQYDTDTGYPECYLPGSRGFSGDTAAYALLYIQGTDFDEITGILTVDAAGAESRMLEKINLTTGTVNTGAANLNALVSYALAQTFGSGTPLADPLGASSISIPSGDRRLWQPGQSCWDLIEAEVSSGGGRLWADLTGDWAVTERDDAPRDILGSSTVQATTYDPDGGVPITSLRRRLRRDGDWYDSSLTKHTYTNTGGSQVTVYQAQITPPTRANSSRGRLTTYDRPPGTTYSLAELIRTRSLKRGSASEAIGRCDFRARPGRSLVVTTPTGARNLGTIRSVVWNLTDDEMTLSTQTARPVYQP